jgi:hypothetical protein
MYSHAACTVIVTTFGASELQILETTPVINDIVLAGMNAASSGRRAWQYCASMWTLRSGPNPKPFARIGLPGPGNIYLKFKSQTG